MPTYYVTALNSAIGRIYGYVSAATAEVACEKFARENNATAARLARVGLDDRDESTADRLLELCEITA